MMVENIYMNSAFSSLYLRLSIILNFSFRSSNERKDLSARAVSRRRTLSYFYWFARWGVVKGRQPPVLPPLPVAVSAPLPPLYAKEVKRERWRERKRKTLLIPASPSFPFGFPTATRSGLSTLGFFRRMLLKKSTHEKERSVSPLLRVTLQPFSERANSRRFRGLRRPREQTRRGKWKVFFHLCCGRLRRLERGNGKTAGRLRWENGVGLNAEKVSVEISFATGVQSACAGNPHLCSNGMGFVRCSAMTAFFS